jgi:hypothetical protein
MRRLFSPVVVCIGDLHIDAMPTLLRALCPFAASGSDRSFGSAILWASRPLTSHEADYPIGRCSHDEVIRHVLRAADGFLLCFSVDDANSLLNVEATHLPRVRLLSPFRPVILVGLCSSKHRAVSRETGEEWAAYYGLFYAEASVDCMDELWATFSVAIPCAVQLSEAPPAAPPVRPPSPASFWPASSSPRPEPSSATSWLTTKPDDGPVPPAVQQPAPSTTTATKKKSKSTQRCTIQ